MFPGSRLIVRGWPVVGSDFAMEADGYHREDRVVILFIMSGGRLCDD